MFSQSEHSNYLFYSFNFVHNVKGQTKVKCRLQVAVVEGKVPLFPGCTPEQKPTGRSCRSPWRHTSSHLEPEKVAVTFPTHHFVNDDTPKGKPSPLPHGTYKDALTSLASFWSLIFSAMYLTLSMASFTSWDIGDENTSPPSTELKLEQGLPAPIPAAAPPLRVPTLPSPLLPPPDSAGSFVDFWCQHWPS